MFNELMLYKDDASKILSALDGNEENITWCRNLLENFIQNTDIRSAIGRAIKEWMTNCLEEALDTERFKHIRDLYESKEDVREDWLYTMLEKSHDPIMNYKNGKLEWNKYCQYHMPFPAREDQKDELLQYVENYLKAL